MKPPGAAGVKPPEPMRRALEQARRAVGRVSPNPPVGAVIVRDGRIVGRGHTQPPGGPHAEIMALRQAGELARGGTLFVTLEPCCRHGRTPPCTRAVVESGLAEVVVALRDPNPQVDGAGLAELEAAGIRVRLDPTAREPARELVEAFACWITTGRPFVTVKYAMTLDGRVASPSGDARWISGPASRRRVHELRAQVDAILVGRGTAERDDPRLTARPEGGAERQPLRVVLDSRARLPLWASVLSPELPGRTLVAVTEAAPAVALRRLEGQGAEVVVLPAGPGGVDLGALLAHLGRLEATSLLVEGGPRVLGSFFGQGLVHKVLCFVAPRLLGGGRPPLEGQAAPTMAEALQLERPRLERLGEDLLLSGYVPVAWPGWAAVVRHAWPEPFCEW